MVQFWLWVMKTGECFDKIYDFSIKVYFVP